MIESLYKLSLILLIGFFSNILTGQGTPPQIVLDAKITSVENQGARLDVVKVFVSEGGKTKDSIVTQNGRLFYPLDTGKIYKIEFTKSGYVAKHLIVSSIEAPKNVRNKSKLKIEVILFKEKKGLDVDFLKTKPMGVARYNYMTEKLEWDKDYTRSMIEKIITATLDNYQENHPDE